ncbi:MAG: hypothetical protein AABX82_09185 [Nanoarchaeota archaeon]
MTNRKMTNRKILVFSRHGKAPQREDGGSIDSLVPETVTDLYTRVGCPLQAFVTEQGITAERTYLHHSPAVRTRYTGEAILAGAFNLQPRSGENPPRSIDDLSNYNFRNDTYTDPRLFFGKPYINMTVYNANNAVCNGNMDYWLDNPDATEHDGAAIESYRSVEARVSTATKDALQRLMNNDWDGYDFGVLITHAGLIDTVATTLIGTAQRVEKCADIGGGFAMAQGAQLVIDKTATGVYTAHVERDGQRYKVDLDKLR